MGICKPKTIYSVNKALDALINTINDDQTRVFQYVTKQLIYPNTIQSVKS